MAIYHIEMTVHKKTEGHSAIGACAYRAGIQIDEHDFRNKEEVVAVRTYRSNSELHLSQRERIELFRSYEKKNNRKDAQLGIETEFALPNEFTRLQNLALMEEIAIAYSNKFPQQLIDVGFHEKDENRHCHLWRSDRNISNINDNLQWGDKYRSPNNAEEMMWCREMLATITNNHLEKNGFDTRITHLSLKDQGIDREPTKHEGRKGKHSINKRFNIRLQQEKEADIELGHIRNELSEINTEIREINIKIQELKSQTKFDFDFEISLAQVDIALASIQIKPAMKVEEETPSPLPCNVVTDLMEAVENQTKPTPEQQEALNNIKPEAEPEQEPELGADDPDAPFIGLVSTFQEEGLVNRRRGEDLGKPAEDITPLTKIKGKEIEYSR